MKHTNMIISEIVAWHIMYTVNFKGWQVTSILLFVVPGPLTVTC